MRGVEKPFESLNVSNKLYFMVSIFVYLFEQLREFYKHCTYYTQLFIFKTLFSPAPVRQTVSVQHLVHRVK